MENTHVKQEVKKDSHIPLLEKNENVRSTKNFDDSKSM